jgi:hypothetical protein
MYEGNADTGAPSGGRADGRSDLGDLSEGSLEGEQPRAEYLLKKAEVGAVRLWFVVHNSTTIVQHHSRSR